MNLELICVVFFFYISSLFLLTYFSLHRRLFCGEKETFSVPLTPRLLAAGWGLQVALFQVCAQKVTCGPWPVALTPGRWLL